MATDQLSQLGHYLMTVDMFPVFFTAHFSLSSLLVRGDSQNLGSSFRQTHALASWFCSLLTALSGAFVANFLFGQPLMEVFSENLLVVYLTVIWYLINYSPFDLVYKIAQTPPVALVSALLQESLRTRFLFLGVQQAAARYPGSFLVILFGGVIQGNGYGLIQMVERLLRGKWDPSNNELLNVSYFTKSALYASFLFGLQQAHLLPVPTELLYLAVVLTFSLLRLLIVVGGVQDPLLSLETPVLELLFGRNSNVKPAGAQIKKD